MSTFRILFIAALALGGTAAHALDPGERPSTSRDPSTNFNKLGAGSLRLPSTDSLTIGATPLTSMLLQALPSGRRAVEQGQGDDLTVSGRPLSSVISGAGGKTTLTPDAITGDGSRVAVAPKIGVGGATSAASRTLQQWMGDVVSAAGRGGTTDVQIQAAIEEARAAGGARVLVPPGSWTIGATLQVYKGVYLETRGTLVPSANVDVVRFHGGARGDVRIDTSGLTSWNSSAVVFDGDSENDANTIFRLNMPTDVVFHLTGSSSANAGTGVDFRTIGSAKSWLMAVNARGWTKGFDKAAWFRNGSGNRFITDCFLWISADQPAQGLVMQSDQQYSVDNNKITFQSQTRPASPAPHVVIVGQGNQINIDPADWDGGAGGSIPAVQIGQYVRVSDLVIATSSIFVQDASVAGYNNIRILDTTIPTTTYRDRFRNTYLSGSTEVGKDITITAPNSAGSVNLHTAGALRFQVDQNGHIYFPGYVGASAGVLLRNFGTIGRNLDMPNASGTLAVQMPVPATSAAAGAAGAWAVGGNFLYVYDPAQFKWQRVGLSNF